MRRSDPDRRRARVVTVELRGGRAVTLVSFDGKVLISATYHSRDDAMLDHELWVDDILDAYA
jgi:hypothetical protein